MNHDLRPPRAVIATRSRPSLFRRIAPALLLFALAPLFGEYLLGNLRFSEVYLAPFLAPLYGAGAVLVREVARRTGRGYGAMLGLGVAYALIEEGLVDQMLFNPVYFEGQDQITNTIVPLLGVDAWLTIIVVAMHAVWSICIPIILVEAVFAGRGTAPWLGRFGFAVVAAIFVSGSVWLCHSIYLDTGFFASLAELVGTAAVITVIVVATFALTGRTREPAHGSVPTPWVIGGIAFAASSLYMLTEYLPGWTRVVACLVIATVFFALVLKWSRRRDWSALHVLGLAGGGILTYAWLGAVMEPETGPRTVVDGIGTGVFIVGATCLYVIALKRLRSTVECSASCPTGAST